MKQFDDFNQALASARPYEALRSLIKRLLDQGADRNELRLTLESFRVELRAASRDADDDVVLEVLDDLTGWTTMHRKL